MITGKLFFTAVALSLSSLCTAQNTGRLTPQRTVVAGCVTNATPTDPKVVSVMFCNDLLAARQNRQAFRTDSVESFVAEAPIALPQDITVRYGNRFYSLFVNPGDSVFVTLDASVATIDFGGRNIAPNNLFCRSAQAISSLIDQTVGTGSVEEQFEQIVGAVADQSAALARGTDEDRFVARWLQTNSRYVAANLLFEYSPMGWDRICRLAPVDDGAFCSSYYQVHLTNLLSAMTADLRRADTLSTVSPEHEAETIVGQITLLKEPLSRDYMLYTYAKQCARYDACKMKEPIDRARKAIGESYVRSCLDRDLVPAQPESDLTVDLKGIRRLKEGRQSEVAAGDFIDYLRKEHSGKVLYIDVFATWCGPCRTELDEAPELREMFVGKDVVFVYLCLGSTESDWLKTVERYKIEGDNYFFDTDLSQQFMSRLGLSGYPSYLLVERDGTLRTTNIPRTSNLNAAIETIDRALEGNDR